MGYDLLIKGGRIYDGSGLPSFVGDVAVKGGRIVEVGRVRESAAQTIDAQGLAVSPGRTLERMFSSGPSSVTAPRSWGCGCASAGC